MKLPLEFAFSQGVLQDYVDCPRRFQLRYAQAVAWPALPAEPALEREAQLRLGTQFHRLVQQHQLGLSVDTLSALAAEPPLDLWWQRYLDHGPAGLPAQRHPEIALWAPLGGYRLLAKYDLLAVEAGARALIVDWKTGQQRPQRAWLERRLQTRVYRYVLVKAGHALNGGAPWEAEQVEMLYWFANAPQSPERLGYDAQQFAADEAYLKGLVSAIEQAGEDDFLQTEDERRCLFCAYRSWCDRGVEAGDFRQDELEQAFDLELDDLGEIAF